MDTAEQKFFQESKDVHVNFSYMFNQKKPERNLEEELLQMNSSNLYCTYRLYNKFFIRGQTVNDFYIVTIGPQECTCTKEGLPLCEHLLFVMVKILAKTDLIKQRTLNLEEIETTFGLPGEFQSLNQYITKSRRDNICVVCTRKITKSYHHFIECSNCKSMIHSTCYDMCKDQSFRLGVDSRCPSCKKQVFVSFEKALLSEMQKAVSSKTSSRCYIQRSSELESVLISCFVHFVSNGLKEYGLRKLKFAIKDQLQICNKERSTKKDSEILKLSCEILNSLVVQSVDISLYNLICETVTDLIWYCNCESMLYFEVLRPLIINILQKCSDPNERIRKCSMDVFKSLAFTDALDNHQKGKFIENGLLYICSFIKYAVGMSNQLLASCLIVSSELLDEIIENILEENEKFIEYHFNVFGNSAMDISLKILGQFSVDVLQSHDIHPTVFSDIAYKLLINVKKIDNSEHFDEFFLSNKQKASNFYRQKGQNYTKLRPLTSLTENLNCGNENLWNKKTPHVPKVPPRDENYRKVLHKTVDDQNFHSIKYLKKRDEAVSTRRREANKLKRSNVYTPSDQNLIILPKHFDASNHPMFDHLNKCMSRRSLSHDDALISKLQECSVDNLKVCQVSAESRDNFCLNLKREEGGKCVYRTQSQGNSVSGAVGEKPMVFRESNVAPACSMRFEPQTESTIKKTFVEDSKLHFNENANFKSLPAYSFDEKNLTKSNTELETKCRDESEIDCTLTSSTCSKINVSLKCSKSASNRKVSKKYSIRSTPADVSCLPCSTTNKASFGDYNAEVTEPYHCLSEEQVICALEGEITYNKRSYDENIDWIRKECVGQGQFADCYKAEDLKSGRIFCVKKIKCSIREEKESSVIKEVHIMRKMKHKNIIKFLGVTKQVEDLKYCLFLELCAGSIVNKRKVEGKFADLQMKTYLFQLFDAISYIHSKGIIHRDIKGKNILVSMKDEIKICDFGAAAVLSSTETITNEFKNEMIGTPPFLAPEIVRGNHYGRNVDVWGTGCVIIELFTGNHPWYKSGCSYTVQQVIFMIGNSKKPPSIPKKMNWKLKSLCRACLVLDQPFRPTARQLLNHAYFNDSTPV